MSPSLMHTWALGLTVLLEGAGLLLFWIFLHRPFLQIGRGLLLSIGLNLLTHTLFWYSFPWLPLAYGPRLWLCEALIALAEAAVYWRFLALSWPQALLLGVALNLLSAWAGLFLWPIVLG